MSIPACDPLGFVVNQAYSAPFFYKKEVPDSFYQMLEQQPAKAVSSQIKVTPSASFFRLGAHTFYFTDIDLNERLAHAVHAAGYEVTHLVVMAIILQAALKFNPYVALFEKASQLIRAYRFLWLNGHRLLLGWQFLGWLSAEINSAQKKHIEVDLSSPETGIVIGVLDIPHDKKTPVELNLYSDASAEGDITGCLEQSTFDCLVNGLRMRGVHRWHLQWVEGEDKITQQFYYTEGDPLSLTVNIDKGSYHHFKHNTEVSRTAAIVSTFFSNHLLQATLNHFLQDNPMDQRVSETSWSGNFAALVPLGNGDGAQYDGVYFAHGVYAHTVSGKRIRIPKSELYGGRHDELDIAQIGIVLNRDVTNYRIPGPVVTFALQAVEQLMVEVGFQAFNTFASRVESAYFETQSKPDSPDSGVSQKYYKPDDTIRLSLQKKILGDDFASLVAEGSPEALSRLKQIEGTLDEGIAFGYFHDALTHGHTDLAEKLMIHLSEQDLLRQINTFASRVESAYFETQSKNP